MSNPYSRRMFVKGGLMAGLMLPSVGLLAASAEAAGLSPLDPNDSTAKALGFATDTTKVNQSAYPKHDASQRCGECVQFQGKSTDASGGCNLFAGKSVPSAGWCTEWAPQI